jgi:hypothetical protein
MVSPTSRRHSIMSFDSGDRDFVMPTVTGSVFESGLQRAGCVCTAGKLPVSVRICYDPLGNCVRERLQYVY